MFYEVTIGWRYLYRGRRSITAIIGLLLSFAVAGLGALMFLGTGKPSPVGVALLASGAIAAVCFGLLSLFSVFTTVSVVGVVLGVAALTVVLSVTSGFQQQFRDKVLGVNAHVIVMKDSGRFANYEDIEEAALSLAPQVVAVQPFVFDEALVTRGKGEMSGVAVKGIDPDRLGKVLDLPKHMVEGSIDVLKVRPVGDEKPPIIVGRELMHKLNAKLGDEVTLVSPLAGFDPKSPTLGNTGPPKTKKFTIRGVFYSGFDEYDRRLMYVDITDAQDFLGQGKVVMGVEMRLRDVTEARRVAAKLRVMLGDRYAVMDWRELNDNLFTALTLQKIVLLIVLGIIIIVAAFNMIAALSLIVIDKTKEIAILKSMGARSWGVARVFVMVGLTIGGVGTLLGLGLGLLLCAVVGKYGYPLDPRVYLIDRLPIQVNPLEVVLIVVMTISICFSTTLIPALRASRLRPVDGLRYD